MVIMCRGDTRRAYAALEQILRRLGLTLNKEKTKIKHSRVESFSFLGFDVEVIRNPRSGKLFPKVEPSKHSLQRIKEKIKQITLPRMGLVPIEILVNRLNQSVRNSK
jgi:hypothetical protein